MAQADKERWNAKYQDNKIPNTPIKLLSDSIHEAKGKSALDIACGLGRHSKYLAQHGFSVDALDISSVAIESLKDAINIDAKEVDFDSYTLAENSYDLIICSYFLERKLFSQMIHALKPQGILLLETFLQHPNNERKSANPHFLLQEGELEAYFGEKLDILLSKDWLDKDYLGNKAMKTSMVARKR